MKACEKIADAADVSGWISLIDETEEALAHLHTENLETLAARAEKLLAHGLHWTPDNARRLAARHRTLGDLLNATGANLDVLRRLQGAAPWER